MILIQKIIAIVVVYLKVADIHFVAGGVSLAYLIENVWNSPWDYTSIVILFSTTSNSVGFTWTSLPIGKYSAIVPIKACFNHIFSYSIEDLVLLGVHVKEAIEDEAVHIVLGVLVAWLLAILGEVKDQLVVLGVHSQAGVWLLGRAHSHVHLDTLGTFLAHFQIIELLIK